MRRQRPRTVLLAVLLTAGLLAGCGASSSSGTSHGPTARASATSGTGPRTAAGIAARLDGQLPRGWTPAGAFGGGVLASFAVPPGWTILEHPVNGSPATIVVPVNSPGTLGPHGTRPGQIYHGNGAAIVAFTPHPNFSVLAPFQVRRSVLSSHLSGYHATVTGATLSEISSAHLVVESWSGPHGPGGDVIVLGRTPSGAEFEAIAELQRGHPEFDPVALIESLHLRPRS